MKAIICDACGEIFEANEATIEGFNRCEFQAPVVNVFFRSEKKAIELDGKRQYRETYYSKQYCRLEFEWLPLEREAWTRPPTFQVCTICFEQLEVARMEVFNQIRVKNGHEEYQYIKITRGV